MIGVMEVLYQYHQGQNIKALKRSLGLARNTIRCSLCRYLGRHLPGVFRDDAQTRNSQAF